MSAADVPAFDPCTARSGGGNGLLCQRDHQHPGEPHVHGENAWLSEAAPQPAVKHDAEKNRLDLLSPWATEGLGQVLTFGAKLYAAHNWRKGMDWSRLIAAAKRHLSAFERGEDIDADSGLPHVDHAAACIHFLSEYQKTSNGRDDRWFGWKALEASK